MADAVRRVVAPGPPVSIAQAQVDAFRLRRHRLTPRSRDAGVEATASAVCGLHAQVQSCAELMWWSRSDAAAPGRLEQALWRDRSAVKTWFMRGTLHVMEASEARMWAAARDLAPPTPAWFKAFGVTEAELEVLLEAVLEALSGGAALTRREIAEAVAPHVGRDVASGLTWSWGGFLKPLARRGQICAGPPRGAETTFVLLEAWLPQPPDRWLPADASTEVARRYLSVFGPAALRDYARWLGVQPGRARPGWSALAAEVTEVMVGSYPCWVLTRDLEELVGADAADVARLLGGFDTYLLGHFDRSHLWTKEWNGRVSRTAGWISPVVLRGGRVVGVWAHARRGRAVRVSAELFEPLPRSRRSDIEQDAERLAGFLDARLELTIT